MNEYPEQYPNFEDPVKGKDYDLLVQCQCGNLWLMDYEPTPEECEDDNWRVGTVNWGAWVDVEGNRI